ncbi:signal peptide peptidase-domain-containing protein [Phycomyces nitens]|nr:signal peptide peptidase-domain-containing protein [Phycomyces nitens]
MESTKEAGLFIAYGALMSMALVPIYVGSIASLKTMKRPENAQKSKKSPSPLDDSDDEDAAGETLTTNDALMFPIIASGVLFSLYMLYRYLDERYLNYGITAYFSIVGCAAMTKTGLMVAKAVVPLSLLKNVEKYKLSLSKGGKRMNHFSFTIVHIALAVLSMLMTIYYGITKNWVASNLFGLSFSVNALTLLSLGSFTTGMSLLAGLFFYDIFWVFGTDVMVSVAKNFDAPIKVLWPRDAIGFFLGDPTATGFTMLGLGDIVIPGAFVALCLHFDRHMAWKRNPVGDFRSTDFPKPYFIACYVAYIAGLATTMGVMHIFHAAQPALLYLSPACIMSALLTAAVRGEIKELFSFSDEETEEEKENKVKKDNAKKDKETKKEKAVVVETVEIETESVSEVNVVVSESEEEIVITKSPKSGGKKKKGGKKK